MMWMVCSIQYTKHSIYKILQVICICISYLYIRCFIGIRNEYNTRAHPWQKGYTNLYAVSGAVSTLLTNAIPPDQNTSRKMV